MQSAIHFSGLFWKVFGAGRPTQLIERQSASSYAGKILQNKLNVKLI